MLGLALPASLEEFSFLATLLGAIGGAVAWLDRRIRKGPLERIERRVEQVSKLNCAHHGLLFDHLGISRGAVARREAELGVEGEK